MFTNAIVNLKVENLIQVKSGITIILVRVEKTSSCSCKNRKYLASVISNSVIMCDEIIDTE